MAPNNNVGDPKIHTNPLDYFYGDSVNYKEWERKVVAIIKQSVYRKFASQPATAVDTIAEASTMDLFNMILYFFGSGHELNTVLKVSDDNNGQECGNFSWKSIKGWYPEPTQKYTTISNWDKKLDSIHLDAYTSCTEFINNFDMFVRKIINIGEA